MNRAFWADRKVFVTGHTGFKGSWLVTWLASRQAIVTGYALPPPTTPNLFELLRVEPQINAVIGNILDDALLLKTIQQSEPEIVFHLAAESLVKSGYAAPIKTYATNVLGTAQVLEAIRQVKSVRAVIVVTSDKCYENQEWLYGYRETDPMGGFDPYSSSKGCAELVAAAYRRSYELPIATVRAGNVIGGGDFSEDRLVPDLMRAFAAGDACHIRYPQAFRPWQFILDVLSGYLLLAEKMHADPAAFCEAWNFGPPDADIRPVAFIADYLKQTWGGQAAWKLDQAAHAHEARALKLDCSKSHARLKWTSLLSLEQTLLHTCRWYQAYHTGEDMLLKTIDEIEKYESIQHHSIEETATC